MCGEVSALPRMGKHWHARKHGWTHIPFLAMPGKVLILKQIYLSLPKSALGPGILRQGGASDCSRKIYWLPASGNVICCTAWCLSAVIHEPLQHDVSRMHAKWEMNALFHLGRKNACFKKLRYIAADSLVPLWHF